MALSKQRTDSRIFYYLMAIFAFLIWGSSFALGKIVSPDPLSPIVITTLRTVLGIITLFLLIIFTKSIKEWAKVFRENFWKYLIVGIFFYAFAFIMEYWSLGRTESSNQAVLSNTMTIWVVVMNFIFFKHKTSKIFLLGLALAIFGTLCILISDDLDFSSQNLVGDIGSLVAYLLWGINVAIMAKINANNDPLYSTFSFFICGSFLLIPLSLTQGAFSEILLLSEIQWGVVVFLGVLSGGIAFFLYNLALSNPNISSEYIAIFSFINPIIGIIMGMIIHNEMIQFREIIGIMLILGSIIIANRSVKNAEIKMEEEKEKEKE